MFNRDTLCALFLLLVCGYSWLFHVKSLPQLSIIFPQVCLIILAFLAFLLLIQGLRTTYQEGLFAGARLNLVKFFACSIMGYLILIKYLGFFMASFFFIMVSGLVFDSERNKSTIAQAFFVSICATVVFYIVFHKIFSVPFPTGIFWS